ncbi:MAG: GSCFA domain-containing protein [Prevotella sp.]|jgi:hypothetical protein|nr:GSCFA domain-containing protein [Prevotella sp.]
MEFRTKIDTLKSELQISHKSRILMFGSCFIENIGKLLRDNKFNVNLNPFGVLYNPSSISSAIRMLIDEKVFGEDDLFEYKELYHSFHHHSLFSDISKERTLEKINSRMTKAVEDIRTADVLIITFGTAYVFQSKESGAVVGNCHKLPASHYNRYRLSVDAIVDDWTQLLSDLKEINPTLKFVFTVSPIRHLKDGAHDNQLSKATLLLAVDRLSQLYPDMVYFPSYEIVLDDLRDYRFYNEDMLHPNHIAIKYIWEVFSDVFFDKNTIEIINEWNKIASAINHKPFNAQSDDYKEFLRQTLLKLKSFNKKYPYICCEEEMNNLESKL